DLAVLDLHGVGPESDSRRHADRAAVPDVEAAVVLRAFDDVTHHQPIAEKRLLMGAETIGGIDLPRHAIDRIDPPAVIEAHYVLFLDLIEGRDADPLAHAAISGCAGKGRRTT